MQRAQKITNYLRVAVAASALLVSGCASSPVQEPQTLAQTVNAVDYTLGSGDKLRITVFNEDRLTGEYTVAGTGEVSFPLIGNVPAAGATVDQLRTTLRNRLAAGYLKDPRVSVEVLNYRPYYILGEVAKPGEYPFVIGLTVPQAVATAGGYTYRANTRRVYIKRALETTEQQLDLRERTPVPVRPGDTIRVSERFF